MKNLITILASILFIFGFIAAVSLPIYLIIVTAILGKILPDWFAVINLILSFLEIMLFIALMLLQNNDRANSVFGRKTN